MISFPNQIPLLLHQPNCYSILITNKNNQTILPFSNVQQISISNIQNQNSQLSNLHFNDVGKDTTPNIIINYTIINNYLPKSKKIKEIRHKNNDDDELYKLDDEENIKNVDFVESIKLFIHYLEMNDGEHSIIKHCDKFGICRRKMYDIINAFESIGCCKKKRADTFYWIGQCNIKNQFQMLIQQRKVDDERLTLEELFPIEKCIGIFNMTTSLLLLFYIFKRETLDLREVALFFSKDPNRFKSTLNKLYHIVHIISAIDLMKKINNSGEVKVNIDLFGLKVIPEIIDDIYDITSVESLINKGCNEEKKRVLKRRNEFKSLTSNYKKLYY